jgi:nucleoside diphosphate kinase
LAFFFPRPKDNDAEETDAENAAALSSRNRQRTLALVRPTAFAKHHNAILDRVRAQGFHIAMHKTVQFDRAQAESFYADQKSQPFFNDLVTEMSSGPMLVLCLVKENAVQAWRDMLGPKEKEKLKDASGT